MNFSQITKIAIFCGASSGNSPQYAQAAEELADVMAEAGITLIYGGAKVGVMGVIADRMLKNRGKVIGVIPQSLVDVEIAHKELTELHVVNSMSERKELIAELSDGFIMLPGGAGSLDEFFEMLTWTQLGYHTKPCGILNANNYYDHLLKFLDHAVAEGFMRSVYRNAIIVEKKSQILLEKFIDYQAPSDHRWIKT